MSAPPTSLGATLGARSIERLLAHVLPSEDRGERSTPVCVWGSHGIGKTALIERFARDRGWRFAYCAPAQFEEMGDLHGLPVLVEQAGEKRTRFAPPAWVPSEPGPGLLLLDDLNRADDRILRGLMQLLQNHAIASWGLPARWHIVATCNPDSGDYSVTPLDDAMLTRMLHVTMRFEVRDWARWAQGAGVDPRGVAFVCAYPEVVSGGRSTPRSLTQFFGLTRTVENLLAQRELVQQLAMSAVDEATASAFLSFVSDELAELPSPEDVLDADDFGALEKRVNKLVGAPGGKSAKRLDRLGALCTRVYAAVTQHGYRPSERQGQNLVRFLLLDALPADLCVALHRDLLREAGEGVKKALEDKALAQRVLGAL